MTDVAGPILLLDEVDTMTDAAGPIQPLDLGGQIVFLAGPPGSGKSSLGSRVCQELGLRFVSLPDMAPDLGRAAMAA